ncbi:hypothetical protein M9458_052437, partial [Cirrhinus mrigala]
MEGPFLGQNTIHLRPYNSSSLTTLKGGLARRYTEVPQVERAVAMHLCPQNATTWRGRPRLQSRAYSSPDCTHICQKSGRPSSPQFINSSCLEFGPADSHVVLRPWPGYMPKVHSWIRAQSCSVPTCRRLQTFDDIKDKNAEVSALDNHLERYSPKIDNLTQHLDDANDKLCMVRKELNHVYELKEEPRREKHPSVSPPLCRTELHIQELASNERSEGPQPKTSSTFTTQLFPANERKDPIQADFEAAYGMTIKDLNKLSNNVSKFSPNSKEGHDIQAHLQEIDFHLEMRPHVTDTDRLYLLRATSSLG